GSLTLSGVTGSENGSQYRAVFSNAAGSATTVAATLTVQSQSAPVVTVEPTSQAASPGGTATFVASASGTPTPSVQWQVSVDGGSTWANVAGATTGSLTLSGVTGSENGSQYCAVFSNAAGSATSSVVTLFVAPYVS